LAALLTVLGVVALTHVYIALRAYRDFDAAPLGAGPLATTVRWTIGLISFGVGLWGYELGWPPAVLVGLALAGVTAATGEAYVRIRHGRPERI